jgi:hypothetical protein
MFQLDCYAGETDVSEKISAASEWSVPLYVYLLTPGASTKRSGARFIPHTNWFHCAVGDAVSNHSRQCLRTPHTFSKHRYRDQNADGGPGYRQAEHSGMCRNKVCRLLSELRPSRHPDPGISDSCFLSLTIRRDHIRPREQLSRFRNG